MNNPPPIFKIFEHHLTVVQRTRVPCLHFMLPCSTLSHFVLQRSCLCAQLFRPKEAPQQQVLDALFYKNHRHRHLENRMRVTRVQLSTRLVGVEVLGSRAVARQPR